VTASAWFGGFQVGNIDDAAYKQIGIERGSITASGMMIALQRVARNLWDFVTSRSIHYERIERKPLKSTKEERSQQPTVNLPLLDRELAFLYLEKNARSANKETERCNESTLSYWIEVLGSFHAMVYCAKCNDVHRHDLLGQASVAVVVEVIDEALH